MRSEGLELSSAGNIAGSSDGAFYGVLYNNNGGNYSGLAQLAPGPVRVLIKSTDTIPGGSFGWVQNIADVTPAGVLLACDLSLKDAYNTWLSLWNGKALTPLAQLSGWSGLLSGALLPSGAVATAQLNGDKSLPLRSFTADSDPAVLLAAGQTFPEPTPAGIDWHYSGRGGSDTVLTARGAADVLVRTGDALQSVGGLGSTLPNGKMALWVGAAAANQAGDLVFTAGFANGSGIFRYRANVFETLADTLTTGAGPNGSTLSWADSYRGRYIAMNNHGDAVAIAAYNSLRRIRLLRFRRAADDRTAERLRARRSLQQFSERRDRRQRPRDVHSVYSRWRGGSLFLGR